MGPRGPELELVERLDKCRDRDYATGSNQKLRRNSVTNDYDYKNYSLEKLKEWITDSLHSEATPLEIYEAITTTLKKEIEYHDVCKRQAQDILDLMQNDNLYKTADFKVEDYEVEHPYAESFMSASDDTISFKSQENNSDGVINFPMRY